MTADGDGKQYNMDATVAYKQAALNAIEYLIKVSKGTSLLPTTVITDLLMLRLVTVRRS